MTDELATFEDRWSMRYVRVYPHPIELVWSAVTSAEELDVWFAPACGVVVEAELGGRCEFSVGGPNPEVPDDDPADRSTGTFAGTITEFEPQRVVHYQLDGSALRFELRAVDGGTELTFTHSFAPKDEYPWRAGFMAGFHLMLDQLGAMLDGAWKPSDAQPYIDAVRSGNGVHDLMRTLMSDEQRADERRLEDRYRAYARQTLGIDC